MQSQEIMIGNYKCRLRMNTKVPAATNGWNAERHCNAYYELHFSLQGDCIIYVENTSHIVREGEALLVLPGQYHSIESMCEDYMHFVLPFELETDDMLENFNKSVQRYPKIIFSEFNRAICREIFDNTHNKAIFRQDNLRFMYALLLSDCLSNFLSLENYEKREDFKSFDHRLSIIDDFFEKNINKSASETDLAKQASLSIRQLRRVLKTHYGMSFREKMRHARMDYAAHLLVTTNFSASKIGILVGYESETSFFKAFKAHYGVTPAHYRIDKYESCAYNAIN